MSQMEQNRTFAAQFEAVSDEKLAKVGGGFSLPPIVTKLLPWGGPLGWFISEALNNTDSFAKGYNQGASDARKSRG